MLHLNWTSQKLSQTQPNNTVLPPRPSINTATGITNKHKKSSAARRQILWCCLGSVRSTYDKSLANRRQIDCNSYENRLQLVGNLFANYRRVAGEKHNSHRWRVYVTQYEAQSESKQSNVKQGTAKQCVRKPITA